MELYCNVIGSGSPVLFLHGWGCDGSIFWPIANKLEDYCKSYMLDFAGFGKSPMPPASGYTVSDYVQCVVEFIINNKLNKVNIVAHSFGGRVAIMLASKYPQLVNKLLLVSPAGLRRPSLKRSIKVARYKLTRWLTKSGLLTKTYNGGSHDYNNCSQEMKNTFVKVVNEDLSRYSKKITCPTLIVNGISDTATTLSHAKKLHKLIKNSELVPIKGDHFALFYNIDSFCKIIRLYFGDNK